MSTVPDRKHIVVIGAGFGGLSFCRRFDSTNAKVTVIDRQNYHLFQPLLYQVATADLSPADIAEPIRTILDSQPNTTVLMDEVKFFDLSTSRVFCKRQAFTYDYLVVAVGARTGYFGNDEWGDHAPGLKSIEDALNIRNRVLSALEEAESSDDPVRIKRLMTVVIVGGGPTGVELAGALGELTHRLLKKNFRNIDTEKVRVVLIQGGDRLLPPYDPKLSAYARQKLEKIGVEVRTSAKVKRVGKKVVELDGGELIEAENIIWAAGVEANPLTKKLGVETDRAGRLKVNSDLSVPGYPSVFAIGDAVALTDVNGVVVPGVAPAAMQMGQHVADIIQKELRGKRIPPEERPKFAYWDKGSMATIGKSAAVMQVKSLKLTGFLAWMGWLFVHLLLLIGFENKVIVLSQWLFRYIANRQGARIITHPSDFAPLVGESAPLPALFKEKAGIGD
jgi:NADH:ubiquinone reductase (H+-translocating)